MLFVGENVFVFSVIVVLLVKNEFLQQKSPMVDILGDTCHDDMMWLSVE